MQTQNDEHLGQAEIINQIIKEFNATNHDGERYVPSSTKSKGLEFIMNFKMKPSTLISYLESRVIKQKEAIRVMATKICGHYNTIRRRLERGDDPMRDIDRIKSNILLVGSTGVGKTLILKLIADKIGVPFVKVDATKYTEAGYVGGDVEDIIRDLANMTKGKKGEVDIELAQYGIVFIDESDKIASSGNVIGNDVSRRGVQQALLTIIEDADVALKQKMDIGEQIKIAKMVSEGKEPPRASLVNTRNILFIFSGAFPGLDEIVTKRINSSGLGFGAKLKAKLSLSKILENLETQDFISYGFEPEFVGRIPIKTVLDDLEESDLLEILKHPASPIVSKFKEEMEAYGIVAEVKDEVLKLVARAGYKEKTGARGLLAAFDLLLGLYETYLPDINVPSGYNLPINFNKQMVDGTINPVAFVNELRLVFRKKIESIRKEIETEKAQNDSVYGYTRRIAREHGLKISFSCNIETTIAELAKKNKITPRQVCEEVFKDYESTFVLLVRNDQRNLEINEDVIKDPVKYLEKAINATNI